MTQDRDWPPRGPQSGTPARPVAAPQAGTPDWAVPDAQAGMPDWPEPNSQAGMPDWPEPQTGMPGRPVPRQQANIPDQAEDERLSRFSRADRFAWQNEAAEAPAEPQNSWTIDQSPRLDKREAAAPLDVEDPPWIMDPEPQAPSPPVAAGMRARPAPPVETAWQPEVPRQPVPMPPPPRHFAGPAEFEPMPPAAGIAPRATKPHRKSRDAAPDAPPSAAGPKARPNVERLKRAGEFVKRGGKFAARKTAAGLSAAARATARAVRRRTRKGQASNDYTNMLIWLHTRLFDRKVERLFFRPTLDPERYPPLGLSMRRGIAKLFRRRKNAGAGETPQPVAAQPPADLSTPVEPVVFDGPSPRLVFRWAMAALPASLKGYAFTDFRAGRGRAMMLAAERNFEKIIGYEHDAEHLDDLQMNVAQYPRSLMACRNVECYRADRDGLAIPDQPSVLYFAHAHSEPFLPLIMEHVAASYRLNPRRMYVILENSGKELDLGHEDIFYRIEPEGRERWMLRLFSPIHVRIYRSLV